MLKKNLTQRTTLEQKVISFIKEQNLAPEGEKLVVAVSGGADSVCLLHILSQSQEKLRIRLHVAHLNHKLRGTESEADAEYVADLAQRLNLPVTIESYDVKGYRAKRRCSLEEAAREVRYSFLAGVAKEAGTKRVAVGHTRDDHVETILMHLIRGAGLTGLRGLQPRLEMTTEAGERLEIVRPLLTVTRQETASYCYEHQLLPRTDSSNLSLSPLRNRTRLELLPLLRKYNQNFDEALSRLSEIVTDELSFVDGQAWQLWAGMVKQEGDTIYLDKDRMATLPRALQRQLVRSAISQLLGRPKDIETEHIEATLDLLKKPVGKTLNLPQGLAASTDYSNLILKLGGTPVCPLPVLEQGYLNIPGETIFSGWRVVTSIVGETAPVRNNSFVAYFDLSKVSKRLLVRRRQPGDRFQPLGMKEFKKLQDFMVDAKIPRSWRERVPLVCSPEQILWVVGWRIDDRAKVTETTKRVLRIEFEPLS